MEFLDKILSVPLEQLPFYLVVLVVAFTVHEFSHAYFANKFGDPTAKLLGRVTLNPTVHFDFLGIILLLIAGFGWARPVPVNRDNFKSPRLMGVVVSAAGPLSNFFLAIIGTLIYAVLISTGVLASISNEKVIEAIIIFFQLFGVMNFFLFLFNLIPLPPLDGYRILEDLVPRQIRAKLQQFEQWSVFIFLLILFIPALRQYTISPLYNLAYNLYYHFMQVFLHIFS
ncbi:site-2 protease family protein [Paenibacillus sp. HJL G12]|uniref:Site-2 protease family protein n=1 Tax=Paenibacillus dendrobii TaxID=2691084 RepID=A0A7X3IKZ0_9BACL|nr:site-2 protease family protein [Paenibacillus dendrobii]MWV45301.1 site-2 protease family protein [Paenibacillus dendrobii]